MSRLMVIVRPELTAGFQLAGVSVYGSRTVDTAEDLIHKWLDVGESGLVAIDDGLLEYMEGPLLRRLKASEKLLYIAIPGGWALGPQVSTRDRIAALIRQAIGVYITFKGEKEER
jgi:vacuolar-type H+-ATPase subunit F/Vma7